MDKKTYKKLCKIRRKINVIMASDLSAEHKYARIFCEKISRKVFALARFPYWDPDASYEEDVQAFVDQFIEHMEDLDEMFSI